jgi:hypothetical protein
MLILLAAVLALHNAPGSAQHMPADAAANSGIARGVVFRDDNANAARDPGEPGIPGVAVSNGLEVVRTDAQGRYELPVDDDAQIFVCKPRNFRTPLDELNKPRFWYTHKPAGSPDSTFKHKGTPPTGPLPASIDFPLTPADEPDDFRVLLIGDPQPYNTKEVAWYAQDVIADIIQSGIGADAAFAVSLGDLVGDDLDLFTPLDQAQARVGIPWVNVFGNHDMNFFSPSDEHSDETFERVYGPPTHAFQVGHAHFIILDNVIWQGFDGLDKDGDAKNGNYRGGLRDDQITFVENYLRDVPVESLVVLCMHIPLEGDAPHRTPEKDRLFSVLARFPNTLSFSAHTHLQRHWFFGSAEGFTGPRPHHHVNAATGSGSWYRGATDARGIPHATMMCGAPNGYNVLAVTGSRYSIRYKPASLPADYQISVFTPDQAAPGEDLTVVANVFAGNELTIVECRLNDGPWTPMTRTPMHDPYYRAIKALEQTERPPNGRPLPKVELSHHIWMLTLDAPLPLGTHTVEVKSLDMFGQVDRGYKVVRIVAPEPAAAASVAPR